MKIPTALEEMVADLISDETRKREEIEGVLSQIHELTERFYNPDAPVQPPAPVEAPAPVLSDAQRLQNFKAMFERKGLPEAVAEEKAQEIVGLRDPRI